MTAEEFKDIGRVSQVRRINRPDSLVRNVLSLNIGEGLVQIDEPTWQTGYAGNEVWVRFENLEIITKR